MKTALLTVATLLSASVNANSVYGDITQFSLGTSYGAELGYLHAEQPGTCFAKMMRLGNQIIEMTYYSSHTLWYETFLMLPADALLLGTLVWDGTVQCLNDFAITHPLTSSDFVSAMSDVATPIDKIEKLN